jgi:hypothetical protein
MPLINRYEYEVLPSVSECQFFWSFRMASTVVSPNTPLNLSPSRYPSTLLASIATIGLQQLPELLTAPRKAQEQLRFMDLVGGDIFIVVTQWIIMAIFPVLAPPPWRGFKT